MFSNSLAYASSIGDKPPPTDSFDRRRWASPLSALRGSVSSAFALDTRATNDAYGDGNSHAPITNGRSSGIMSVDVGASRDVAEGRAGLSDVEQALLRRRRNETLSGTGAGAGAGAGA